MEIWNKLLSGDLKDKMKAGIMIIGPSTAPNNDINTWHADSEEQAVIMATLLGKKTGGCYEIIKYELLGVVRPNLVPMEYIKPEKREE